MTSSAVKKPSGAATQSELFEIADRVLPGSGLGSYSLADDIRLIYSHGKGSRLWDVDGNEYIDYVGGAGALILGHSHPAVVEASKAQLDRGAHMFGSLNDVAVMLAERLVNDIPCAEKIAYATTGSEATAYSMRLARAFTGRSKILKFEGAYHGNHDYAIVSTFPKETGNYPQGTPDSYGQPEATVSTMLVCPYNDLATLRKIVAEHHADIAAIFAEPVARYPRNLRRIRHPVHHGRGRNRVSPVLRRGAAVVRRQARPVDARQGGRRRRPPILYRRARRRHQPVGPEAQGRGPLHLFQRHAAR
jgi:glutamate-1-semialdehyde aminotransferase